MDISNNPAVGLIPSILGEQNSSRNRQVQQVEVQKEGLSQQTSRVISEVEKQEAQQLLQDRENSQQEQNLFLGLVLGYQHSLGERLNVGGSIGLGSVPNRITRYFDNGGAEIDRRERGHYFMGFANLSFGYRF